MSDSNARKLYVITVNYKQFCFIIWNSLVIFRQVESFITNSKPLIYSKTASLKLAHPNCLYFLFLMKHSCLYREDEHKDTIEGKIIICQFFGFFCITCKFCEHSERTLPSAFCGLEKKFYGSREYLFCVLIQTRFFHRLMVVGNSRKYSS